MVGVAMWPVVLNAQFNFTTDNGAITITGYTGSGGAVVIPATTNGLPVTGIGASAFSNQTNVTSLTVPNSIVFMGTNAFYDCTGVTSIMLGTNVTDIQIMHQPGRGLFHR